jgi:hypothetical protein
VRFGAILSAAVALTLSSGALAQGVSYKAPTVDPLAVRIMDSYAQCAVARDPNRTATLLAADYRTDAYRRAIRDFATSNRKCLHGGKLAFSQLIFAGDMAEAVLRRERVSAEQIAHEAASDQAPSAARCIVQKRPRDVAALLATKPTSDEEHDAITGLGNTLIACTPRGQTAITNTVGLRAELALATYHMIHDQTPEASGNR